MVELTDETGEIAIRLNTNDQSTMTTGVIVGKLDALILKTNQKAQIIIESELGYTIFHKHEFEGVEYNAPRTRAVSMLSDQVSAQDIPNQDKFNLNERLIITLIGPKNTEVNIILRLS